MEKLIKIKSISSQNVLDLSTNNQKISDKIYVILSEEEEMFTCFLKEKENNIIVLLGKGDQVLLKYDIKIGLKIIENLSLIKKSNV